MPLLKKKALEKAPMPEFLKDDEEVFHCEMTNEIFRNYEEFAERTILCNSMVWTCSMTGKSNLTYVEALQSEENSKKSLKDFPVELRIPVLYLANKTKRTNFTDMAEDVFSYIKDRYFVGENVEACFSGNKWRDYHVLQVIAPNVDEIKNAPRTNGTTAERQFFPSPSLYKYDLEQLDSDDEDVVEKMMVDHTQMRRRKGTYTKDKNKLFLKQYVEQNNDGVFCIKESSLESFGVNRVKFVQIFDGPLPDFESSKKAKGPVNGKKVRQETLAKYLTKNNLVDDGQHKVDLIQVLKKKEMEMKQQKEELRQKNAEKKLAIRQKRREENSKMTNLYKEWAKLKDDLELEDQKKLPEPTDVKCKVPDQYIGDMFTIMEFVNSFSKILLTKNFFPGGFTFDIMERALMEKEVAGPLIDLVQMLLNGLFSLQEEESSQTKIHLDNVSEIQQINKNPTIYDSTKYATIAAKWASKYHGMPLGKLPMYSLTVSEILRLHLLSSGARVTETGARWRFQQRGGYTNEDDPGLYLRRHQPRLLKSLALRNVVELSIGDKLTLISCLMNQLLTYADVRDVVEERLEISKQNKFELKTMQFAEKKRQSEFVSTRAKLRLNPDLDKEEIAAELEKLEKGNEKLRLECEKKIDKIVKTISENQSVLGYDRAFRRYVKLDSVPGMLVEFHDDHPGTCSDEITRQMPEIINADRRVILDYILKQSTDLNTSSDKENDPSKTLSKINGISNGLPQDITTCNELLMCSADPKSCIVHSKQTERPTWGFFSQHQVEDLIAGLNSRGLRESELLQNVQMCRQNLQAVAAFTPGWKLNPDVEEDLTISTRSKGKTRYEEANFGFPTSTETSDILHSTLTELVLEMEGKIFAGNLGMLKVKDRNQWRNCLNESNYENFERTIDRDRDRKVKNGKFLEKEEGEEPKSRESTPDFVNLGGYVDPGCTLPEIVDVGSEDCDTDNDNLIVSDEQKTRIECLAIALAQIAHAVESKYLKRPLGEACMQKAEYKNSTIKYVLPKWEESLLASTSYSQVFLHYGTLDACIMWKRSALWARCRVCRRQTDTENMLTCDNCNYGMHLYCHKPKMDSIPKGEWLCYRCLEEKGLIANVQDSTPVKKKRRRIFREEEVDDEEEELMDVDKESDNEIDGDESRDDEDDEESVETDHCRTCGEDGDLLSCEKCSHSYHIECVQPPLRRKPRGHWMCTSCKDKKSHKDNDSDSSVEVASMSRRSGRREAEDLPLHNAALHDLLIDVMKHEDAWPFIRPVQKNEVPDYYDVITKPMDFGTIKYKLNMGNYTCDEEFMADAVLVFENCNTYNNSDAEVYQCGVRLLKVFEKKSTELGLKLPEEMQQEESDRNTRQPKNKKRRTK